LNGAPVLLTNGDWVGETSTGGPRVAGCSYCGRIAVQAVSPKGNTVWTVRLPAEQMVTPLAAVGSTLYVLYWPDHPNPYMLNPPYLASLSPLGAMQRTQVPLPTALSGQKGQFSVATFPSSENLYVALSWKTLAGGSGHELIDYAQTGQVVWVQHQAVVQAVGAGGRVGILLTRHSLEGLALATGKVLWRLPLPGGDPGDIQAEVVGSHSVMTYRVPYDSPSLTYAVRARDGAGWSRVLRGDGGLFSFAPVVEGGSVFGCNSPIVDGTHKAATCRGYSLATGKVTSTLRVPESSDDVASIIAASAGYVLLAVAKGPWLNCTIAGTWPCGPSQFVVEAVSRQTGRVVATGSGPSPFNYTYNAPDGRSVTLTGPGSAWVW
jgi:hypothetical protein